MLNLFLRTVFLYAFLLFILRLTGKRQVADLEPFDLIVTLVIADVGSNAISDTNIPLLYSVVPIIGLYLIQQVVARACLKSDRIRHWICGTPQLLIRGGVLQETVMRRTNYTIHDLIDHLREKDVFDIADVEDAVLETNGSLSVRLTSDKEKPSRSDLRLKIPREQAPQLLIREGRFCSEALEAAKLKERWLTEALKTKGIRPETVFYAQLGTGGMLRVQQFEQYGSSVQTIPMDR